MVDRLEEARHRALIISGYLRKRDDIGVRSTIQQFDGELDFANRLEDLAIASEAWDHVLQSGIEAQMVFAHPELLRAHPNTSVHYRGIATLSLKRVQALAGQVGSWENGSLQNSPSMDRCVRVARVYNAVISAIITGTDGWTMENGYRNVLATIGITQDGALRNIVGGEGEQAVKDRIIDWLEADGRIPTNRTTDTTLLLGADQRIRMVYSSEPDISFEGLTDAGEWGIVSTIEVKSGTDPAGALERLGAIEKSFAETPARSRNFVVLGIKTPEMERRLKDLNIAKEFLLYEILNDEEKWSEFVEEVFHHTLRLI